MPGDDDDILRGRDPLYLIPNTYKPANDQDFPPWTTADPRENDHKMWLHKYKFFSHALANKREEQFCQFYGGMSQVGTKETAGRAAGSKCADIWPTLDAKKFTYEATMERIIGNLEEKGNCPKHMTEPLWNKYKYFSGGRERLIPDDHGQEQDHLHTFKNIDRPVATQKLRGSASSTDVVEQAAARLQRKDRTTKQPPRKSQSEAALGGSSNRKARR